MAQRPPRDRFPNHYVGDLVPNAEGTWTVVPPIYCANWHVFEGGRMSVSAPNCECGQRHRCWMCWCGAKTYAPKLGPRCRIYDSGEGVTLQTGRDEKLH